MTEARYFPFSAYLKERFGERVHKVSIDAGFTCPNIDGLKAEGGCTYCNNEGFSYNSRRMIRPIPEQIETGVAFMRKRFKAKKYIAYFQAHTNTYAPVSQLKAVYDQILPYEELVALSVGTRPDCISNKVLDLLESYSDQREVWVEYGLQTTHNETLKRVNRKDTYERFLWAIEQAEGRNLKICVHVILGLPGESHEDMMLTAERLASVPYDSLKIHLLHVMKNTQMEDEYRRGLVKMFTLEEYVQVCCDFVERIRPEVSIQRLTADAPPSVLVAPEWCLERKHVINSVEAELERRSSRQGSAVDPAWLKDQSWRKLVSNGSAEPVAEPDHTLPILQTA
ncbi:MAG: TIGR01212 family radical SAM protein [Candidatus Hinthialibacter antarcticus]|nr:TIGR01212 family radical SAM protein [Candidatus Hinthialibacter antarcticus]